MDWDSSDANDNKHGYFLACPLFSKFLGLKQDFFPNNGEILTHDHRNECNFFFWPENSICVVELCCCGLY